MKNLKILVLLCFVFFVEFGNATNLQVKTSNMKLQRLFDNISKQCNRNIREYVDGRKVLVEGDIWIGLWLETQPMGGFMYAKFNPEIALNNMNIIMEGQREDGLIPAMTELNGTRWYGSLGMNMIAAYGINVYYMNGENKAFLERLYNVLESYDRFLWKYRDTDNDECLEQFGVVDTGEDGTKRYILPRDANPTSLPKFAIESSLIMSDSYINRKTLAEISNLLNNGKYKYWKQAAYNVAKRIQTYLWDEQEGIIFDRDSLNTPIKCNNSQTIIRTMFMESVTQSMADIMVERHLMNPNEFFTEVPLPSIAPQDPLYLRSEDNEYCAWSGPSQGLTLQRCSRALSNYGHYAEIGLIAERIFKVLDDNAGNFNVQYNPLTSNPMGSGSYGPTILAAMEFFSQLYGIVIDKKEIAWNGLSVGKNEDMEYIQKYKDTEYKLVNSNQQMVGYINGRVAFKSTNGVRIITDINGNVNKLIGLSSRASSVIININGRKIQQIIRPNEVYTVKGDKLLIESSVRFSNPQK